MRELDSDIGGGLVEVFCMEARQSQGEVSESLEAIKITRMPIRERFETRCRRLYRNNAGIRVRKVTVVASIRDSGGTRMIGVRCGSKLRSPYGQVGV